MIPAAGALDPADAVVRFLESTGRRSEYDFYLRLFRSLPKERFAAISVGPRVARMASEAVVLDLRFLHALGLCPLVIFGVFEPTEAVELAGRVARRLERAGVPSETFGPEVDPARIIDTLRAGRIALLPYAKDPPGPEGPNQERIDARVLRMGEILAALQTRKLIFLHHRGPLKVRGNPVELVNLTTEAEALLGSRELSKKQRLLLATSRRLVFDLVPTPLQVAIASPLNLLRELFTVRGAGTLLRRGAVITRHEGWEGVDLERLRPLVARSFGRPPNDTFFARPVRHVYLEEGYRGAAILVDSPLGAYLTKFVVEPEAQGEGMGRDLWDIFAADHPVVFWRARPDNPISDWYGRLASGLARFPGWTVYWKGLAPARIAEAIDFALTQPVDLPAPASDGESGPIALPPASATASG